MKAYIVIRTYAGIVDAVEGFLWEEDADLAYAKAMQELGIEQGHEAASSHNYAQLISVTKWPIDIRGADDLPSRFPHHLLSCLWCHKATPLRLRYCIHCGHRGGVPRAQCDCLECRPLSPRPGH